MMNDFPYNITIDMKARNCHLCGDDEEDDDDTWLTGAQIPDPPKQ